MTVRISVALLLTLSAATSSAPRVYAELFAYEGFDYDIGNLNTQAGGAGWGGAWSVASNAGLAEIVTDGLTYTDAMGNDLLVSGRSVVSSAPTGSTNGQAFRLLSTTYGGTDGTTTWWSFIGHRLSVHATDDENLARAASLQLHNTTQSTNERLAVGKGTNTIANPPIPSGWAMLHSGNAANSAVTAKSQLNQAFLVVRIDHILDSTVPDNAWLWVNPRLDVEPDVNMADQSLPGSITSVDFSFNRIRAFAGAAASTGPYAAFAYDEIRLGTTFADVAPIDTGAGAGNADFDGDGDVDGADFLIWQTNVGMGATQMLGDAMGDGDVDGADLEVWKSQFGPAAAAAPAAVPEPGASVLGAVGALLLATSSRRRRQAQAVRVG